MDVILFVPARYVDSSLDGRLNIMGAPYSFISGETLPTFSSFYLAIVVNLRRGEAETPHIVLIEMKSPDGVLLFKSDPLPVGPTTVPEGTNSINANFNLGFPVFPFMEYGVYDFSLIIDDVVARTTTIRVSSTPAPPNRVVEGSSRLKSSVPVDGAEQ